MKRRPEGKRCRDCRYLCGEKTVIGIECRNPMLQRKWSGAYYKDRLPQYKYPHQAACSKFQPRVVDDYAEDEKSVQ